MKELNFKTVRFLCSACKSAGYPALPYPEIAVVGRSNVGKSTLLNHLFQSKKLVKTSSTPGKTQLLNFFTLENGPTFVDLPGYGFAKADTRGWKEMIESYLSGRENLRLVLFLLDIRRIPGEHDTAMAQWLAATKIPTLLILTKTDKLSAGECHAQTKRILEALRCENHPHLHYSAPKNKGRGQLITEIVSCLR